MGAHYCAICRHTSFNGKSHIFSKTHQSKLRVVLLKFFEKVKEARRTLKTPLVETFDVTQHMDKFWCYCCQLEVERNITDGNMTVIWGGLLEHMAKPDHRKNTHKFWWENNADPKLRDRVIFTEEEIEKFKTEVRRVLENFEEKEDHFVKQQTEKIRVQEMKRQEMLQSFSEHETEADLSNTPNGAVKQPKGVGRCQSMSQGPHQQLEHFEDSEVVWSSAEHGLTFIGHQDSTTGNVHTGAVPPWLQDDPQEGTSASSAQAEIGPSVQGFIKQRELEKSKKLPPNRVGANFDHSSNTDANWLPSFGRVWNSGRRWQSRHQFRQEEGQKRKRKRSGTQGSKKQY
ncbi:coiled-coil domain-containing protein 84 [Synchiropus splendidus]|uniref:coiled-coil domain-containing protein 84 n=1 Tax=Synchiropus splendidus TaxID=270530 RepID=UPI00237E8C14|nr:coiled-coil domain-containing protein 84 [Synchiropus splendidus]